MATLQFDLVGNVKLNTQQAQQQMAAFVGNNNMPRMAESNNLPLMSQLNSQNTENLNESTDYLDESFRSLKDVMRSVLENFKALNVTLDETEQKYQNQKARSSSGNTVTTNRSSTGTDLSIQGVRGVQGVIGSANSVVGLLDNGNIGGAFASGLSGVGSGLNNMASMAKASNHENASANLMKAAAGFGLFAAGMTLENTLYNSYADSLQGSENLLKNYGTTGDLASNSKQMSLLRTRAAMGAKDTGLTTEDYIDLVNSMSGYGVGNFDRAKAMATEIGMWSHYTGADTSQLSRYAGTIERFGGNGSTAISQAYQAATAQGLEKGQFGEFLSGLQSVIENGIAKGYVKSTKDVAEQLTFLTALSDNSKFWEGEKGVEKYQQMAQGMANSVNMQSTEDVLLYRAVQNSGVVKNPNDPMGVLKFLESGDVGNESFLKSLKSVISNTYAGDDMSATMAVKKMFGISSISNAEDVLNMIMNVGTAGYSAAEIRDKISSVSTDGAATFKTEFTNNQNAKNDMNSLIQGIGGNVGGINTAVNQILSKINERWQEKKLSDNSEPKPFIKENDYVHNYDEAQVNKYVREKDNGEMETMYDTSAFNSNADKYASDDWHQAFRITRNDIQKEAERKKATSGEIQAWEQFQQLESNKVSLETYQDYQRKYTEAIKEKKWNGDYVFNNEKLDLLIAEMKTTNSKLENMHMTVSQ